MIDGKVWELNNAIGHFEAMDYIMVKGKVTNFQGNNQLNIEMIRKADEGEYQISDYMPSTKKDIDEMFDELLTMIQRIQNPYLKELCHADRVLQQAADVSVMYTFCSRMNLHP